MSEEKSILESGGKFVESLRRNFKQIKDDRAAAISEDAELFFKREVEDVEVEVRKLRREREALIDISPSSAGQMVTASDFNAKAFVSKDLELGVKIRNLEIKLQIAKERYDYLFGAQPTTFEKE